MTRRLSPVPSPDLPPGGLDLVEARRNLGLTQAGALRAVDGAPPTSASPELRARLQRLQDARQAALRQLAELDETITRAEAALGRTQVAQSTMSAIENEAAEATRAWIAGGARDDAPSLSAAQRQALEAARSDFETAQRQAATVQQSLETLRVNRQQLASAIGQADAEIRQTALAVIATGFEQLFERYVETAKAAIAAEHEARALITFLQFSGYGGEDVARRQELIGDSIRRLATAQLVQPVRMRYEDEEQAARAPYIATFRAQLEKLLAGEESL